MYLPPLPLPTTTNHHVSPSTPDTARFTKTEPGRSCATPRVFRPPKTNKSCWAKVEGRLLSQTPPGREETTADVCRFNGGIFFPPVKTGWGFFFLRKTGGGKRGETEPLVLSLWLTFLSESLNGGKMWFIDGGIFIILSWREMRQVDELCFSWVVRNGFQLFLENVSRRQLLAGISGGANGNEMSGNFLSM